MSSWRYAFFFPNNDTTLKPERGISDLYRFGFKFDNKMRKYISVGEEGFLVDAGEQVEINGPIEIELQERLLKGEQFSIECRNSELFVSCHFTAMSHNPCVYLGWIKNLFIALGNVRQTEFRRMLIEFASHIFASYVIIVDDASDNFEDRFLIIDGKRMLDTSVNHKYGHGIQEVWVDVANATEPPEGVSVEQSTIVGAGFVSYMPVPAENPIREL